jgi:hypothetical protein
MCGKLSSVYIETRYVGLQKLDILGLLYVSKYRQNVHQRAIKIPPLDPIVSQFIPSKTISPRSILILSLYLCLFLPSEVMLPQFCSHLYVLFQSFTNVHECQLNRCYVIRLAQRYSCKFFGKQLAPSGDKVS